MNYQEQKEKYPILAVRMKRAEMDYLRREAKERDMKLAKYVKTILIPFPISDDKITP